MHHGAETLHDSDDAAVFDLSRASFPVTYRSLFSSLKIEQEYPFKNVKKKGTSVNQMLNFVSFMRTNLQYCFVILMPRKPFELN